MLIGSKLEQVKTSCTEKSTHQYIFLVILSFRTNPKITINFLKSKKKLDLNFHREGGKIIIDDQNYYGLCKLINKNGLNINIF